MPRQEVLSTPRPKPSFEPTTPAEQTDRVPGQLHIPSPHYQTTRRHSLYGTEDRVVLDLGSRVWKAGFSGEGRPRDVFTVGNDVGGLWELASTQSPEEREEKQRVLEAELQKHLRYVFHNSLLTDPKSRKVIIVEPPLIPIPTKELFARILFENLQVPSLSFIPSHLLSLLAVGRISGLVLDSGHLESVVLPVVSSRPLYSSLKSTPLAGAALTSHLRHLLLKYGSYTSPTPLAGASTSRATSIPEELLTDVFLEDIKTRCCFVAEPLSADDTTPIVTQLEDSMSVDISDVMETSGTVDDTETISSSVVPESHQSSYNSGHQTIFDIYIKSASARTLSVKVLPPSTPTTSNVRGTLTIPGWIRERAAEYLFQGDIDESSVAEVILDSLLTIPCDLRKSMISSILVVGGTAMLPGFIPRLHAELIRALTPRGEERGGSKRHQRSPYNRYKCLQPLLPYINILNNPSLVSSDPKLNVPRAPAFSPAALPWIGGSLSGSLKTGGEEITRERWDEFDDDHKEPEVSNTSTFSLNPSRIPDWSWRALTPGAPSVASIPSVSPVVTVS